MIPAEILLSARQAIGPVEGHELDDQQVSAILNQAHNHLVAAGAGTGKTTAILGKIRYLLASGMYEPEEILVLSYTRNAAEEMKKRLVRCVPEAEHVSVSTFHSLGYRMIRKTDADSATVFLETDAFLKDTLHQLLRKSPAYRAALYLYLKGSRNTDHDDMEFLSLTDYTQHITENPPVTLNGERVKSYGEMHTANILAVNGIRYHYEKPYFYHTADPEHAQYMPDFYLPDYDIYIEFFGIDRSGNVPAWFKGDNPGQTYRDAILWKRALHQRFHTTLIECYAYEDAEGILQINLENRLKEHGVVFSRTDPELLINREDAFSGRLLSSFLSTAKTVISLARNNQISPDDLLRTAAGNRRAMLLARLASPLLEAYEQMLAREKKIDFADMMNRAERSIREGKYHHPFRMVIVDEYQDITASQFRFLQAMRQQKDFDLFCVGDDWQSIYRFNGSDVSYLTHFASCWGAGIVGRIETTYRFSASAANVSGTFIMANPYQFRKTLRSNRPADGFGVTEIEGYQIDTAIRLMTDRLLRLPPSASVFLLGRYTFDIEMLKGDRRLSVRYDTASGTQKVFLQNRRDLNITFLTVHRAKGLEADFVYILNTQTGTLGFPSGVEDNPLIDRMMQKPDPFPYAEERRLFYVALTRAKRRTSLITVKGRKSDFVNELLDRWNRQLVNETYIVLTAAAG
ncbi:MAG: UvrD-helicase domain-containing protein [Solobacterium sp.]|nr:UvrD-helicase domain-containing protein [Solobacterium sp.]